MADFIRPTVCGHKYRTRVPKRRRADEIRRPKRNGLIPGIG
jgi:hypothetical protein